VTAVRCPDETCPIPVCDECRRYWGYTRVHVTDGVCSFGHRASPPVAVAGPACWADPLNREERAELARMLARWCSRFYNSPAGTASAMHSQIVASAEMAGLHLDVTERAEVPAS